MKGPNRGHTLIFRISSDFKVETDYDSITCHLMCWHGTFVPNTINQNLKNCK